MTPLQKQMKENLRELDLETFGSIMDDFIKDFDCKMLIEFPKGNKDPVVKDNMGGGPVLAFYFILKAITPTLRDLFAMLSEKGSESFDKEKLADTMLEMVKAEIMEA